MEELGPSTSMELDVESMGERLFLDEDFKGEFTNALLYANSIYESNDLLTKEPPKRISSVSIAMAECFSSAIIDIINENYVMAQEDLILYEDSDNEGLYEECKDDPTEDEDYDPTDYEEPSDDYIPLQYKEKVVALAEAHPHWNLKTLQKRGASRLKRKDYLIQWKADVKSGGTRMDKLQTIDAETFERFKEARNCYEQVTTRTLQQWALVAAAPFQSANFTFQASSTWVTVFKRRHKIKQRKITKYVSHKDVATLEETLQSAERFQIQTKNIIPNFNLDFVINTDQTGCNYQTTYNRSLEFQEVKTVFVKKNINKITHSYTAQYSLTASGKLLPFVYLCMQEPTNKFGPTVSKTVEKLTAEFGNVVVTCSKSGKLTKDLYKKYLETTLKPYVTDNNFLLIIDSWGGQTDAPLHDEVFGNDGKATCTLKVIPGKCTPFCQPCDVYFYRQVKNLIKRLQNASALIKEQREIASREDVIKIHSLVHHQLSAPSFTNMIKYAWYAAKLVEERTCFSNVNEICFPIMLGKQNCSVCKEISFIRCAWCMIYLCFKCFYDNYHVGHCERYPQGIESDNE
ncbi:uncharacterized protein LOC143907229 [Temnothorax americanus]|uniref:uncharacterized protein LOC143907229 n=1 Tax=Temnothorax americanus TaxID=1964332 RepID=UPI00406864E2